MSELERLRAALPANQLDRLKALAPDAKSPSRNSPSTAPAPAALTPSQSGLQPLTSALVASVLDRLEADYEIDENGDCHGWWEQGYIYFQVLSEAGEDMSVYQVHAVWEFALEKDKFGEAVVFANEWNSSQGMPMAIVRIDEEEDLVGLYGETIVDFGPGVTFGQLTQVTENGIAFAMTLFEAAEEMFADVLSADAELGETEVEDGSIEP